MSRARWHLGSLSTKIKTERREDVTIPNSVVVATPITNYSRFADVEGVFSGITVTIGYDVPWRQIQAMLLLAAERTSNIKRSPPPVVRQSSLGNVSVEYALLVCFEQPTLRSPTLGALRANVLDVFNEFGVQRSWCPVTKGIRLRPKSSGERNGSPRRRRHPRRDLRSRNYCGNAVVPQASPFSAIEVTTNHNKLRAARA